MSDEIKNVEEFTKEETETSKDTADIKVIAPSELTAKDLPEKFSPLSPWAYFGLNILFSLPVVGFVMLIVFSFNDSNIHRRNYARSFWCYYLIIGIIIALAALLGGALLASLQESLSGAFDSMGGDFMAFFPR